MQFSTLLTILGAITSMITVGSAQLDSRTGCVGSFSEPITCTFSWIFFTSEESSSDDTIQAYINTSSCEELVEGGGMTTKLGVTSTMPASKPGLTLPLTLTNPTINTAGPVFTFNGTTYDVSGCECGTGPNTVSAATGYACSCPFDCTAFNNVAG